MNWFLLITSLSGNKSAPRVRLWRALKASGAAVLRDGVYLLPEDAATLEAFDGLAGEVRGAGGSAYLLPLATEGEQTNELRTLFDRSEAYAAFIASLTALAGDLSGLGEAQARRRLLAQQRELDAIVATDFFVASAREQAAQALAQLTAQVNARYSPDEPSPASAGIARLQPRDYQGQLWATRARPWVDRLASAWLIRRHIDPQARFLWLASPADCPAEALGFDFDGASFSHVGERVSFEVLLASFGLEGDAALMRLAALVHFLDVGGLPVVEADGIATLLAGARARLGDDDALLAEVTAIFDSLYAAYAASSQGVV